MNPQISAEVTTIPAGLRWSPELADKARSEGRFVRVGGQKRGFRALTGAEKSWSKDDERDTIFQLDTRLTGSPDNIRSALEKAGKSKLEINRLITNSITATNYTTTMRRAYQEECDRYKNIQKDKPTPESFSFEQLKEMRKNIKSATPVPRTVAPKDKSLASRKTLGTRKSLKQRFDEMVTANLELSKAGQNTKVLDVSNMDENGKKASIIAKPKLTSGRSKKVQTDLPIVTDKIEPYEAAVKMIFGDDAVSYQDHVNSVKKALLDKQMSN